MTIVEDSKDSLQSLLLKFIDCVVSTGIEFIAGPGEKVEYALQRSKEHTGLLKLNALQKFRTKTGSP